jgi:NitT/TauT family transport system ATP-binding protein
VFQNDVALFPWLTVQENIEYGLRIARASNEERRSAADRYLNLVGLAGHNNKFPRELSGGMKQRVQIARVLANEPTVLLMDEPFAALDAYTRTRLQRELEAIWLETRQTVIFVTHDISEAVTLSDTIVVMSHGPGAVIQKTLNNPHPRPRDRMDSSFVEMYNSLNDLMAETHADVVHAGGTQRKEA